MLPIVVGTKSSNNPNCWFSSMKRIELANTLAFKSAGLGMESLTLGARCSGYAPS
jgi:hypothetical protein